MKIVKALILIFFAVMLIYGTTGLPDRGDPDNQMHAEQSMTDYFISEAYHDAKAPNMVTVILGDYRSVDTLGEQVVIFTAGMITILLLRRNRKEEEA